MVDFWDQFVLKIFIFWWLNLGWVDVIIVKIINL